MPSNDYRYPNGRVQGGGMTPRPGVLRKGMLFQRKVIGSPDGNPVYAIDVANAKKFQFNPPEIEIAFQGVALKPPGTEQDSGNEVPAMGSAATNIKLLFVREQEVYSAHRYDQPQHDAGQGPATSPFGIDRFGLLGVQQDVYDVMAICMGDDATGELPADRSMRGLTAHMRDLAVAGSAMVNREVGIMFSDDFVVFGFVSALSIRYVKWSADLVPTWAYVDLSLDIFSIANAQRAVQGTSPAMTKTHTGPATTTPATTTPSNPYPGYVVAGDPANPVYIPVAATSPEVTRDTPITVSVE